MRMPDIGKKGTAQVKVSRPDLASSMGSGCLDVFATPAMVALMENAACSCIADCLEGDETTVGTALNIEHVSASPEGCTVTAEAVLTGVNGRELTFDVSAHDNAGLIGKGTHKRFVVYAARFTEKAKAKI